MAAMELENFLNNGHSQASTRDFSGSIGAPETFSDAFDLIPGHADTLVTYRNASAAGLGDDFDANPAAQRRVFLCIAEDVNQCLFEFCGVSLYGPNRDLEV